MADVGTAVAMERFGANFKRLPEWLITPNAMQKCDFSHINKKKLRPDCMIGEIKHDEIYRALKKRNRNGDTTVPTQIIGRPRKIWLIELGYSSATRYIDKVIKKKKNIQDCANCLLQRV
jgi:hypothetical protein